MALFLNEGLFSAPDNGPVISFHEAYAGLLELTQASAALTEWILMEDYVLDKTLNEYKVGDDGVIELDAHEVKDTSKSKSTALVPYKGDGKKPDEAKKDFLKRVWEKVKAFALKLWAHIKDIARLIVRKVKNLLSHLKVHMIGGEVMLLWSESTQKFISDAPRLVEKMLRASEMPVTAGADFQKLEAEFKSVYEQYHKLVDAVMDKRNGLTSKRTPAAIVERALDYVEKLAGQVDAASKKQEGELAKLEKDLAGSEQVQAFRTRLIYLQKASQSLMTVLNHVRPSSMPSKNPKAEGQGDESSDKK